VERGYAVALIVMTIAVAVAILLMVWQRQKHLREVDHLRARVSALQEEQRVREEVTGVLRTLASEMPITMVALDTAGYVTLSIGRRSRTNSYTDADAIGMHLTELMPVDPWYDLFARAGSGEFVEEQIEYTFGRVFDVTAAPVIRDDQITGVITFMAEVSGRVAMQEELRYRAETDDLSGLPNRSTFQAILEDHFNRRRTSTCLIMADVDGFKFVNDTYGHASGDAVLKTLADRLRSEIGPDDVVARLGGDEFGLVVDVASSAEAWALANQLRRSIAMPVPLPGGVGNLTASLGIVGPAAPDSDITTCLVDADLAMYEAKRQGGDRAVMFDVEMRHRYASRERMKRELVGAIQRDEFVVHYQPIWDLATGHMHGVEGLVRWDHPVDGLRSPASFLGAAEEGQLLSDIDFLVFRKACKQLAEWTERFGHPTAQALTLSTNFGPRQLGRDASLTLLEEQVSLYALDARRVTIEVTETALLTNIEGAEAGVEQLRRRGVQIALDDFGTGYSSLAQLHALRPDVVKIDQTFVQATDPLAESVAGVIVSIADALAISTVAEGVETVEQLNRVRSGGCNYVQGNLLGSAMPAPDLEELLRQTLDTGHPTLTNHGTAAEAGVSVIDARQREPLRLSESATLARSTDP